MKMEYGFKCFTGAVFTDDEVDTYNRLSDQIERFGDHAPEEMLNGRHNFFNSIAMLAIRN